jgi:pyruvate/2-oxoglutarate dehydrogenase complex dihydrolipoamide dehydrogenase (E3) component
MEHAVLIRGAARFTRPHTVMVDGRRSDGAAIFINVGGRAAIPPMPGVDDVAYDQQPTS